MPRKSRNKPRTCEWCGHKNRKTAGACKKCHKWAKKPRRYPLEATIAFAVDGAQEHAAMAKARTKNVVRRDVEGYHPLFEGEKPTSAALAELSTLAEIDGEIAYLKEVRDDLTYKSRQEQADDEVDEARADDEYVPFAKYFGRTVWDDTHNTTITDRRRLPWDGNNRRSTVTGGRRDRAKDRRTVDDRRSY